jgi:hypothetical protein
MKLFLLLLFMFVAASSALGQRNVTNDVSTTIAIKVASQLTLGVREEEARKVLATNGLPQFDRNGGLGWACDCYPLSNGKWLMLCYTAAENVTNDLETLTNGLWKGRLSYALIRGNVGDADVTIKLSNAPNKSLQPTATAP